METCSKCKKEIELDEGFGNIPGTGLVYETCYSRKSTATPKETTSANQLMQMLKEEVKSFNYAHHFKLEDIINTFEPLIPQIVDAMWQETKKEPTTQ